MANADRVDRSEISYTDPLLRQAAELTARAASRGRDLPTGGWRARISSRAQALMLRIARGLAQNK